MASKVTTNPFTESTGSSSDDSFTTARTRNSGTQGSPELPTAMISRRSVSFESSLFTPKRLNGKPQEPRTFSGFDARAAPFTPSGDGVKDRRCWSLESGAKTVSLPSRISHSAEFLRGLERPGATLEQLSDSAPKESRPRKIGKKRERTHYSKKNVSFIDLASQSGSSESHVVEQGDPNGAIQQGFFDPYTASSSPLPSITPNQHQPQMNMYAQDPTTGGNTQYYQANSFSQPLQYHLYTSLGPHRENLLPYQRSAHDFFIPDNLREDLQRKSAATLQTLPSKLR